MELGEWIEGRIVENSDNRGSEIGVPLYVYRYQTIFLPSVSIDIEISGHETLSWVRPSKLFRKF